MAEENRTVTTTYTAKLDQQSFNKVSKDLKKQNTEQVKAAKAEKKFNQDLAKLRLAAIKDEERQEKALARERAKALKDKERLQTKIDKAHLSALKEERKRNKDLIKQEKTRAQILDEQNSALRRQVGSIGDIDSSLSAIRGGLGAVSGGAPIGGLTEIAGVFELTEAVVQLKGAAPAAKAAISGLTGSIGKSGVGLIGAMAAVTLVMMAASAEAQRRAEIAKIVLDSQREYFELIQSGTSESIAIERRSAKETLDASKSELKTRKAQREAINKDIGELSGFLQGVVQVGISIGVTGGEVKELDNLITELEKTILENELAVKNYNQALKSSEVTLNDTSKALLDSVNEIATRRQFEDQVTQASLDSNTDLNEQLLRQNDIIAEQIATLRASGVETDDVKDKLKELANQHVDNQEKIAFLVNTGIPYSRQLDTEAKQKEILEKRGKEQAKEREKIASQRETTLKRLNSLEAQSNKALEDFARKQTEITQKRQLRDSRELEDFNAKQSQVMADHNQDLAKIQADSESISQDFFKDEIEATRDYRKDLGNLNRQFRLEDEQDLADHLNDLQNAEQNNDVIAFLQAQRNFDTEQKTKEKARSEEFRDLNNQHREERRLRQEAFNERKREIAIQMSETRRAFAEEQRLDSEARQRKLQRQSQDDQIADSQARTSLQRTLSAINIKAQAEMQAIQMVTNAVRQLQAVASRIASNAGSRTSSTQRFTPPSRSHAQRLALFQQAQQGRANQTQGRVTRTAFEHGGIVPARSNTQALLGDGDKDEAIIPFNRSRGLPSALQEFGIMGRGNRGSSGSPSVVVNFAPNVTVGDIATGSEVTSAFAQYDKQLQTQIQLGLSQAINQTG